MKKALTALFITGLATGTFGSVLAAPSSAQLLENIGIGAGAGIITGTVVGDDAGLDDVINGGAAGAAVEIVGGDDSSLAEDAAIGAAASAAVGTITNDDSLIENAIQGGAAGALINILGN
ncbi:hypothetical protein [Leptothoe spongobia]|uniref:hypothetical protein n=1 Tax=Leptothoe spongobia TaxID=2651728 RepID=UPI001C0241CA|nr:hypothetical protein [Leptothoe spongobia]